MMVLFGWYGTRRGLCLDPGEGGGGGGTATAAPPASGAGDSAAPAAPASSSSGSEVIQSVFEPGSIGGDEVPAEEFQKQIVEYAKTQKAKVEGERAARSEGKKTRRDGDSVMPVQRVGTGRARNPDGTFAKPGAAPPAPAVTPTVVNPQQAAPAPQLQPPPATAAAPAPTNGFTEQHYQLGAILGLTKEQLATFGSAGQFEGWVLRQTKLHDQRQAQAAQQQRAAEQQQVQWQPVQLGDGRTAYVPLQPGQQPQPVYQNGHAQQQPVYQNGTTQQFQPLQLAGPEDEYDPAIVQMLKFHNTVVPELIQQARLFQQFAPQLQSLGQLQQELQSFRAGEQQRQMTEMERQVEQAFAAVDKELFGEGHFSKIEPNQMNARVKVSDVMAGLVTQYNRRGEALPPSQTLVEMARAAAFPDRLRTEALSKAAGASQQLRSAATAVPTARQPAALSETERAIAKVREFQREHGMSVD